MFLLRREFSHERRGLRFDDPGTEREVVLAVTHVLAHDGFEVIDVVEVHVFDLLHVRINVARHGDID